MSDTWELVKRNTRHIIRTPELLLDVTIQPIIFVLLFRYVFGGAIPTEGTSYVNYLMAGIFVQTIAFAMLWSGVLLANDLQKGIIDRFRALPMASWAVVAARTITDLFRSMIAIAIMIAVGLAVGFRPDANVLEWIGRDRHAAALRLRAGLDRDHARHGGAHPGSGDRRDLRLRLPADLRQQRLRADRHDAELAGGLHREPADDARDQHGPRLDAGQRRRLGRRRRLIWSIGLLVLFFPVALCMYRKRTTD